MPEPRDVSAGLFESAREDAAAARLIADAEVPDRIVGFPAQQAVEMFLKAVLARRGVGYERTHDIERLTSLVSDSGLEPPADVDELAQLTPWAVERRYGDPFDPSRWTGSGPWTSSGAPKIGRPARLPPPTATPARPELRVPDRKPCPEPCPQTRQM